MSPTFLDLDDVLALHDLHLQCYGGSAGVRDRGLLESAVSRARASFGGEFLRADLTAMAAAYLVSIVKNHPFIDGNKRAGLASALTFPRSQRDCDRPFLGRALRYAEGRLDKVGLAEVFRGLASSTG